jgi:hypothetical protein
MYQSVGFIAWQVSKRSSNAHRQARAARRAVRDALALIASWEDRMYWFLPNNPEPCNLIQEALSAADRANRSDLDANTAWLTAYALSKSSVDQHDEAAVAQVHGLHGAATRAADDAERAASDAAAALKQLRRFKPTPGEVKALP